MDVTFFQTAEELRAWFNKHHADRLELWVGFYKKGCGQPSISWPESVDEALCVGWIDGIRKSIDEVRYKIRFTPRKAGSIWSAVNIKKAEELIAAGRMQPAGLQAFQARQAEKSAIYAYEQEQAELDEGYAEIFRQNQPAWQFFQAQPNWYRKTAIWWVISAKQAATRMKRLNQLIEDSAHQRPVAHLNRKKDIDCCRS